MAKFTAKTLNQISSVLVRTPEKDFEDDGTKFKTYSYKGMFKVTYATYKDNIYLAVDHPEDIPYDFIKNYQGYYLNKDALNGVEADKITILDVVTMLEDAENVLNKQIIPAWKIEKTKVMNDENFAKVREVRERIAAFKRAELEKVKEKFNFALFMKLNDYEIHRFKDYWRSAINSIDHDLKNPITYYEVKKLLKNDFNVNLEENLGYYLTTLNELVSK